MSFESSFDEAALVKLAHEARTKLRPWLEQPTPEPGRIWRLEAYKGENRYSTFGFAKTLIGLGGIEGAASLICAARLDKNGDGHISPHEMELFQEECKHLVDNALNQYLNNGVVAALILSIVVPLASQPSELGDECIDKLGENACHIFQVFSFVAIQITFTLSLVLLYLSTVAYKQLSFWMPDLPSQLWFITNAKMTFAVSSVGSMMLMLVLPVYVFFSALSYSTWAGGCTAIPMGAFLIFFLVEETLARSTWPYVHARAKAILLATPHVEPRHR